MPIPCLAILSKNQRRISLLGLGLDHSLEVAGSSTRQAGAITGPRGPRKASQGGLCRNDGKVQSTVTRKALSLAGRALSREGNIYINHLLLFRQLVRLFSCTIAKFLLICKIITVLKKRKLRSREAEQIA